MAVLVFPAVLAVSLGWCRHLCPRWCHLCVSINVCWDATSKCLPTFINVLPDVHIISLNQLIQVQALPMHYKPRLRPYLTRPPPPPTDGASSNLPLPTRPIPSPPLPSFKDRFLNFNQHICDQSCTLECCDLFGINETLCLNGRLPDHDHPGLPHRRPFIGRILTPYSICYSQCNKRCSYQLPPTIFQCTAGCRYHFIDTKSAELTDLDADKVKKHAASCYHKCKKIFEVV